MVSSELSPEHFVVEIIRVNNNHCNSYRLSFIFLTTSFALHLQLTCFLLLGCPSTHPHLPVGAEGLEQIPVL